MRPRNSYTGGMSTYTYPHTIENGTGEQITFVRCVRDHPATASRSRTLSSPAANPRCTSTTTSRRLRAARDYSQEAFAQEAFAQEAKLNRAYMGGVERGQRNVGVVNLCDCFSHKSPSRKYQNDWRRTKRRSESAQKKP